MKKRFIFLVMLFALLGGVNWNVLNAQEIVEIGSGNSNSSRAPIATYYNYSYSQQILTASEINHDAGTISSIAFKIQSGNCSRNITIYMQNTTKTTFDSTTDWVAINANDNKVFEGNVNFSGTDWITLDFTNDFTYDGGNILLCMQDNSGSSGNWTYFLNNSSSSNVGLSLFDSAPLNPDNISGKLGTQREFNSYIQLTFTIQDDLEPAVPANLTATAKNHTSIELTWEAAENAISYNVYKNGTLVGSASTTSYLAEGLEANTQYCFTVTGVRGAKESDASNEDCATTAKAPLVKEVLVGAGDAEGNYIPTYTYYNYSTTQQIYTAEELGFGAGNVTKIAFYNNGSAVSRNIDVYITNTTKANFTGSSNMVNMTAEDKVYSGTYTFTSGWCEIAFSKAFEYTGGNILICVDDNTGSYVTAPTFKANVTADYRANYMYDDSSVNNYDPLNVAGKYTKAALYQNNQIKFFVEAEPGVTPNVEAVNFAEVIRLGNYWSEKYTAPSAEVKVENIGADITSIESSNDFFVLSENIDLTASNIVFNVTCKTETSYAGTQNGNIVISYEIEGVASTVEIPVTATAYAPAQADVIELATNVTFTEGTYTNTPDFAKLHDDYILPGEATEGSTPDAVYHFTMEEDGVLTVNVTGTNAIAAVYKAGDMEGSGPMANNNYKGIVPTPAAETTFEYTFEEENVLDEHFTLIDKDNDGQNWKIIEGGGIENKSLKSFSYDENNISRYPDNYIVTKEKYLITNNSELHFQHLTSSYPDKFGVEVSTDGVSFTNVWNGTFGTNGGVIEQNVNLSAYAGESVYIALRHYESNGNDGWYVIIDNLRLTDGSAKSRSLARSTEPQINAVQYPAGEYYLVAAAEDAFSVTIETATLPAPEAVTYTAPENGAMEQNNPKLSWTFGKYTSEYQVLLGTTNPPTDVVVNWTSELATSFQTEALANQTTYYWQVNVKNATGTTAGEVYSFITPLNQATELEVTDAELYPGETTILTWTAAEDALSYNVYLNDTVKLNETAIEETSLELTNLPHNVNPGNAITVTAVHTLGESAHSEAIYVKMAGEFNLVVNVKDAEGNAIENAAVAFITESNNNEYYDEYYQLVPAIETLYTDAEGKATKTLAMPCVYGSPYWYNSNLEVVISKEYATSQSVWITSYTGGLSAGQDYVQDITLEYIAPENVQADKYYYVEGEDMVLTWNEVEGAVGYNVYKVGYSNEINDYVYTLVNEEAITGTTFTVENLKYDLESLYVTYAVTADYGFVESAKNAKVYPGVTGEGQIAVTVTDGTNPIKGATVTLVGYDGFDRTQTYTFVTNEEGKITGDRDMLIGSYYTATVSHYDYNEKVMEEYVAIEYQTELSLDIVLEAKQAVEFEVTAAESGDYVNVTWEAAEGATSYNVYRRDSEGNVQRIYSDVTSLTATDYYWTLEAGTYEYGVNAMTVQEGLNITEDFEDGIPSTWAVYNLRNTPTSTFNWTTKDNHNGIQSYEGTYAAYAKSSTYGTEDLDHYYLVTDLIDLTTVNNPQLSFAYYTPGYYGGNTYCNTLKVKILTESDGQTSATNQTNHIWSNNKTHTNSWQVTTVDLTAYIGQKVYVAFENYPYYGYCSSIDFIKITSQGNSSESKVNWSNEVVREAYATFNNAAGDNDWSNEANWSTEAVPAEGENVIIAANANLNTVANVAKIRINGSATLTLNDGAELTVTGTITQVYDSYTYSSGKLVINDGAQLFQSNENVYATFNMNIVKPSSWSDSNKDGWQFIASPFNSSSITNFVGLSWAPKSYDLYKYEGNAESGLEWNNHKDGNFEEAFVNGRGYLASYETLTTATLSGYLYNKDNFEFTEVSYTEGKELANFHLLGNPFSFDMDWSGIAAEGLVDGYAVVNNQGGYDYLTSGNIKVGDGFFVKATGANASLSYNHKDVVPATRGSEKANSINVIATSKAGKDNVVVNFAGQAEGFNKLQNFNDAIATVYVSENGKNYGIANVDENTTEVALNFDAKEMGSYTISLDVNGEFETVTLVDRFTGVETNMLVEDEYSFIASNDDNVNRFVIRLAQGSQLEAQSQFVYQSGEELILSIEGSVQIVDMLGRVVYSNEHASGNNRIYVGEFNDASYVVRVINEEGVKVQKVVIY